MLAGLRPDTGRQLELSVTPKTPLNYCLESLDRLTDGASFVLGHNVLRHDLPVLSTAKPGLSLLQLPVIDTLNLSPLAFPQNPYHRLVKDYKLVRESLNSPLKDCISTLSLFSDQRDAFLQLAEQKKSELLCYQSLLAPAVGPGLGNFMATLTGQHALSLPAAAELLPEILAESDPAADRDLKVCRFRLERIMADDIYQADLQQPLAYALAWLRVSGGKSVLPPWVYHQFPDTERLLHELRDIPCDRPDCQYCQTTHNPEKELQRYFGFPDFRYDEQGTSLQREIIVASMSGKNVLAVLATGGGKSLCYQLPALNRYYRNGSLTVIISPLQSLMKDQVDGLATNNIGCAAALNGLLSMPERADVLEQIQMGDVGILLVSPEQFRNRTFQRAISNRRIGAWIFDEAHCLSKWGHDFRPDYLYAARFIREFTATGKMASIGCFTATAKPDVLRDIENHFHEELGIKFETFIGTHERPNLSFEVMPCEKPEKQRRTLDLLNDELSDIEDGAVVFVSSRKRTEEYAEFISGQGWACQHYHAGLDPNEKKDIQDAFKTGQLRIIVATNAFGMGVDKSDIRLVIHADIPGSLENYLQEAGRAGRDQQQARCVLLYCPDDIETQFGLAQASRLSFNDIQQIYRKLRRESQRRKNEPLVITSGEILQDEDVETQFNHDDRDAATKVSTAVSWLEKGQYLVRDANVTRIFAAKLQKTGPQIQRILDAAALPIRKRQELESILNFIKASPADERVTTDQLTDLTGQTTEEVVASLQSLEALGVLTSDTRITMYLRHGVDSSSRKRLQQILTLEKALFQILTEVAPDADSGEWQDVSLNDLTSRLRDETDIAELIPPQVLQLLKSLSRDRSTSSSQRSSFELRIINRDYLKIKTLGALRWQQLAKLGEKRRELAGVLMEFLIQRIPDGVRGKDLMVDTTFGGLQKCIADDIALSARIPHDQRRRAVEHVLLYLHQSDVLVLNHGMAVMRHAMTISVNEQKNRYLKSDFSRLEEHYQERLIQVHVMREYASRALEEMAEALKLVLDYFSTNNDQFLQRHFAGREDILQRATSEESWQSIVDPLSDQQRPAVVDDEDRNRLVLAGPGSGKTRVIVHRVAYLLRVRRVPANAIVVLSFNRHAANEIRKRLHNLVGQDAYGVTVLTYHSLAMRLTGIRFERDEQIDEKRLQSILRQAADLLGGQQHLADGEDSLREQLLRGYRFILVDEYQDIDDLQYQLVSALAGRHRDEEDRLCILAVGDDDQNIYAFRKTSNEYIERYQVDYQAEVLYLVENYRSSGHIIEAANRLIAQNTGRLKQDQPITIDSGRRLVPRGGYWSNVPDLHNGQVVRLEVPAKDAPTGNLQAQIAMQWLQRLRDNGAKGWSDFSVLARSHKFLLPLQAWCEQQDIPYFMSAEKDQGSLLTRNRTFVQLVDWLRQETTPIHADRLDSLVKALNADANWSTLMADVLANFRGEFGATEVQNQIIVDWLYDYFREVRQRPSPGLFLGTTHSAKGLEFKHVVLLDGDWRTDAATLEEQRRLYYVGMTRAEQTLALCEFSEDNLLLGALRTLTEQEAWEGHYLPELEKRYRVMTLKEVDIGFAGRLTASDKIHDSLKKLQPGDPLKLRQDGERFAILDENGNQVGRTTKAFELGGQMESACVASIVIRYTADSEEAYQAHCQVERWEVVLPRLVLV